MEENGLPLAHWPPPPPFYKAFTPENQARLEEAKTTAEGKELSILGLPSELRSLIPPEPPATGKFRAFGQERDINASVINEFGDLNDNVEDLIGPYLETTETNRVLDDKAVQLLKKMIRSIMLRFLEVLGELADHPESSHPMIPQIGTMFINMVKLINEYRPHQARETLMNMMEDQLDKKKAEVEGIKKMKEKVDALLAGLGKDALDLPGLTDFEQLNQPKIDEQRRAEQSDMWQALDDDLEV